MRHRLCGMCIYGLSGPRQEEKHPAYNRLRSLAPFVCFTETAHNVSARRGRAFCLLLDCCACTR